MVVVVVLVITLRAIMTNTGHTINNIGVHNHWAVGANHISPKTTESESPMRSAIRQHAEMQDEAEAQI